MPNFLLEIGCEEIPARMIEAASEQLRERVNPPLNHERLTASKIASFDTPRSPGRDGLRNFCISARRHPTTDRSGNKNRLQRRPANPLPLTPLPRKLASAFLKLDKTSTAKGEYLTANVTKKGRAASEILAENLPKEIALIYWPKNMYWCKTSERFVRPVRWLVALLDGQIIPLEFDGIRAGNTSRGHRILSEGEVSIPGAGEAYLGALRHAKVLGCEEREEQIRKALDAATRTIAGARWREDKALLDSVVNLTEFPSVILGTSIRSF